MEKSTLREVIATLNVDQQITVNFRSTVTRCGSGDFLVVGTRKGRGKGGSLLAELKPVDDETAKVGPNLTETVVIGTPNNDEIVNVIVDGVLHGNASESELSVSYDTDETRAVLLKRDFLNYLSEGALPVCVHVEAPNASELNGTHTIVEAEQKRGRHGQVVLRSDTGVEFWSFRHSSVIDSITVVESFSRASGDDITD